MRSVLLERNWRSLMEKVSMERLNAYVLKSEGGRMLIDVEGIIVDLVTVFKLTGKEREELIAMIDEIWPAVKVTIKIPKEEKQ